MAVASATARHIFVTGQPGVGKTTLVMQAVEQLKASGIEVQGFYTEEVRDGGRRIGFDVVTMDGTRGPLARTSGSGGPKVGQYTVNLRAFEQLALPYLAPKMDSSGAQPVFVVDEVGKMEIFSQGFVQAVRRLLNQPYSTVLGTIPIPKGKSLGIVDEIRKRRDVKIYNLKKKSQHKGVSKVVKAVTASLEFHKQLCINRQDMQAQLVTKVMAQVHASLGEQAIQDMCDQIMADIAEDTQRDLCLQVTKATIGKLVTKMVAAHLNHQYSKNVTCRLSEITNGQQDQLVSMVLKAVQATLHLQVLKEMHEHFSREREMTLDSHSIPNTQPVQERLREGEGVGAGEGIQTHSVQERLQSEVADVIQHTLEQEAGGSAHDSGQHVVGSNVGQPEVTEVVGLVRDALYLQLRTDVCDQVVSAILDKYLPD